MEHSHLLIGVLIFIVSYIAIVSEKINRTTVALIGGALTILFHVVSQEEALEHIDFNTIGLLIGMMIMVTIIKQTGVFQYLAIKTAKVAKGKPLVIMTSFAIITAVASGLLDNVTTILLIVPVTLVISDTLEISPIPFIITEILAANIGGAATLIGDPPNIMIGSFTGYSFLDFIVQLGPLMVIIFVITLFILKIIFKKSMSVTEENKNKILGMDENKAIRNKKLLVKSIIVLALTIVGFSLAEFIGLESATVAILGAALLLLISKLEPEEILVEVEWGTIFFFAGLFVLVGGLQSVGVISILAEKLLLITEGDINITTYLVLWMSAILSSFLDNIPYVATMIPMIDEMSNLSTVDFHSVWWALAIGACLGGNGTIIGASANVVARGIVERSEHKISFLGYMKIAYPLMLLSIIISTIYLALFYL